MTWMERGRQMRRLRWRRWFWVQLTGLAACAMTLLTGAYLTQFTYATYTSSAEMSGNFSANESFCTPEQDWYEDCRDPTVSEKLYEEPPVSTESDIEPLQTDLRVSLSSDTLPR